MHKTHIQRKTERNRTNGTDDPFLCYFAWYCICTALYVCMNIAYLLTVRTLSFITDDDDDANQGQHHTIPATIYLIYRLLCHCAVENILYDAI